jgi:hypothetical protein
MVYRASGIFFSDAFSLPSFARFPSHQLSASTFVLVFGGFFSVGKLKSINGQCFSFS